MAGIEILLDPSGNEIGESPSFFGRGHSQRDPRFECRQFSLEVGEHFVREAISESKDHVVDGAFASPMRQEVALTLDDGYVGIKW